MGSLDAAISLAVTAHRGHLYPADEVGRDPFILHPLRVMLALSTEEERTVGVLHDIIEDTDATLDDLRRLGLTDREITAVDLLTHREGEAYEAYIDRLADNPLARSVKLADLRDNLEHGLGFPGADEFAARHRVALTRLSN